MASKQQHKRTRDYYIAEKRLEGMNQTDIAKEVGISQKQVSNILRDEEIREYIDRGIKYQVNLIPKANERHEQLMDSEDEGIRLKAVELIYKNTGISPTHAQSTYIQNVFNDNRNISCSPEMLKIIGSHVSSLGTSGQPKMLCDTFLPQDVVLEGDTVDEENNKM